MKRLIISLILAVLLLPSMAYAAEPLDPDAVLIAQTIYAEARGVDGTDHKAAVAWCILNRVDDPRWGDTVKDVVTQRHQFAWNPSAPVTDELYALAVDVLARWQMEKVCIGSVGRVLPSEYVYFAGDSKVNRFRTEYEGAECWDWTIESPYEEDIWKSVCR